MVGKCPPYALGSPVAATNETGAVIERNDYEPYGAIIGKPTRSGIGYTGHVMDGATGLTYMQQRYYDESIGRFLSVDPVAVDGNTTWNFNRYYYASNNPYAFIDPDGRSIRCNGETCHISCPSILSCGREFATYVYINKPDLGPLGILTATAILTKKTLAIFSEENNESNPPSEEKGPGKETQEAIDNLRENKTPVPGTAGERGELQGEAEDADSDFDNLANTPGAERKDENNIRMPDGSNVNRHSSTRPYPDAPLLAQQPSSTTPRDQRFPRQLFDILQNRKDDMKKDLAYDFVSNLFTLCPPPSDPFALQDCIGIAFDRNRYENLAPDDWWASLLKCSSKNAGERSLLMFRKSNPELSEVFPNYLSEINYFFSKDENFLYDNFLVGENLRWAAFLDQDVSLFGGDAQFIEHCLQEYGGKNKALSVMRSDFIGDSFLPEKVKNSYEIEFEKYFRRLLKL